MRYVHASQYTVYGKITVDWKLEDSKVIVRITIPANTTAEVNLPGITATVGSGQYTYEVDGNFAS